jgi:F0F1-type ATP synthase assembly protein I
MQGFGKVIGESLTLGIELALPTLLLALAGYYLDKHFSSCPVFLVSGVFLGGAAGFWSVVKRYLFKGKDKHGS